jgi:flavodoxin
LNVLVVYDSTYGNTEEIARAIALAIGGSSLRAADLDPTHLGGLDLLIIGSPTHGGFPTPSIDALLKAPAPLRGVKVAVFDTRTKTTVFGYAAPKIARKLQKVGAQQVAPPEGFFVRGTRGPLLDGEVERASDWAKRVASSASSGSTSDHQRVT